MECNSGISGDMMVAALLDLGAGQKVLETALKSLPVHGFETEISQVKKAGLDVCDFNVKLDPAHGNHDHDMEYLYGHNHAHTAESKHGDDHAHITESIHEHGHEGEAHPHGHHEHHHPHEHRGLPEIVDIIEKADISRRARDMAVKIFQILAQAEAKAHGVPVGQVHFHEVGAVDSIVDIVAVAVCLDDLDIEETIVPVLCEGRGTVRCQHGILPVPVPAVVNIMEAYALPVRITQTEGELVTPTGAAIVAAIKTSSKLPRQFKVVRVGMGAGKRSYEIPSILRAMLIEKEKEGGDGEKTYTGEYIYKLESNIDDCTGEALGYVMDRLMEAGARDVHFTPVFMKKNRPAYELVVICDGQKVQELEKIIFRETTTIGIRRARMERTTLFREEGSIMLKEGEMKVKKCTLPDGEIRLYPEYESAAHLAQKSGQSFWQVMDEFKHSI